MVSPQNGDTRGGPPPSPGDATVVGIWLLKYDSINQRFVKSSSKCKILAWIQSVKCSLPTLCLVSANLSNRDLQFDNQHLRFDKSALTKHVFDNKHSTDWTNAKVLDFKLDFTKCRFIESYFINKILNTMNHNQNDKFPSIYSATVL